MFFLPRTAFTSCPRVTWWLTSWQSLVSHTRHTSHIYVTLVLDTSHNYVTHDTTMWHIYLPFHCHWDVRLEHKVIQIATKWNKSATFHIWFQWDKMYWNLILKSIYVPLSSNVSHVPNVTALLNWYLTLYCSHCLIDLSFMTPLWHGYVS